MKILSALVALVMATTEAAEWGHRGYGGYNRGYGGRSHYSPIGSRFGGNAHRRGGYGGHNNYQQ